MEEKYKLSSAKLEDADEIHASIQAVKKKMSTKKGAVLAPFK